MTEGQKAKVVRVADLVLIDRKVTRNGGSLRYLEGARYGLATSIYRSEVAPGSGSLTHSHPYTEYFIVHEGQGRYVVGDEEFDAQPGDVIIVPPGARHSFTNVGTGALRLTAIHEAPAHQMTRHRDADDI